MAFGKTESIRWYNFWVCFAVALGAIGNGYPAALIGPTLGKTGFLVYMGLGDAKGIFPSSLSLTGAITGVFQAGSFFGVVGNSFVTDRFGRKAAVATAGLCTLLGAVGMTASVDVGMFIAFRFFSGAGSAAFLAVVPLYVSELAPPAYRGFFGGMVGTLLGLGYAIASYMGLAFYFTSNVEASWRVPLGIGIIFPLLILLLLPFLPESPRFLLMVDKHDEAWKIISKLHKDPKDPDQEFARSEFYQMQQQASFDRTVDASWLQMLKRPSYRRRAILVVTFAITLQSTAVLVINNYGPTFYKKLGFDARDRLILQSGRDSIALFGNFIGALLLDRFGRRRLILVGLAGCIICLSVEAAIVAQYAGSAIGTNKAGLGVGVCALYTFLVFYAMGLDAASFVWIAEIFPTQLRAKGATIGVATTALIDVLYLQVTPLAFAHIGWKYFLVYAILSAVGFVWFYFKVVETNGIPLEEIAAIFGDNDDVMVYSKDVLVDHNTHKLVVLDHEQEGVTRVVTEQYKPEETLVEKVNMV